jgi:hypothetical protein
LHWSLSNVAMASSKLNACFRSPAELAGLMLTSTSTRWMGFREGLSLSGATRLILARDEGADSFYEGWTKVHRRVDEAKLNCDNGLGSLRAHTSSHHARIRVSIALRTSRVRISFSSCVPVNFDGSGKLHCRYRADGGEAVRCSALVSEPTASEAEQ